ncbi:hypothetical protein GGF40_002204 [Coemansia sp. RSA 1286]|nr:hypothetical protein IWW45_002531 [Coemansia sp. RSA 485]KAJ2637647.1 hypothetical protein GGF40_002204 [Coemansia sp. RSA 1286]
MAAFSTLPKTSRALIPKLKIPTNTFEQELSSTVWVPNPETTKFKTMYSAVDPLMVSEIPISSVHQSTTTMPRTSIYCSQCKAYYITPAIFYNHINTCSSNSSTSSSATLSGTMSGISTITE